MLSRSFLFFLLLPSAVSFSGFVFNPLPLKTQIGPHPGACCSPLPRGSCPIFCPAGERKVSRQPWRGVLPRMAYDSDQSDVTKAPHKVGDVIQHDQDQWVVRGVHKTSSVWVLDARDRFSEKSVQIHMLSISETSWSWDRIESFERETKLFQSLRHRGLPRVEAHWKKELPSDVRHYRVMSRPAGESLEQLLAGGWRPTERDLLHIGIQLLQVVEYLKELRPPVRALSITPDHVIVDVDSIGKQGQRCCWLTSLSTHRDDLVSAVAQGYLPPAAIATPPPRDAEVFSVGALLARAVSGEQPTALEEARWEGKEVEMSSGLRHVLGLMMTVEAQASPSVGHASARSTSVGHASEALHHLLNPNVGGLVLPKPPRSRVSLSVDPHRLELVAPRRLSLLWCMTAALLGLTTCSIGVGLFAAVCSWTVLLGTVTGMFAGGLFFVAAAICSLFFIGPTFFLLSVLYHLTRGAIRQATLQHRLTMDRSEYLLTRHAVASEPKIISSGDVWKLQGRKGRGQREQAAASLSHLLRQLRFLNKEEQLWAREEIKRFLRPPATDRLESRDSGAGDGGFF